YAERWGVPDIKYCEETICHFISEPANTWSNLSFIVVGLIILFLKKKPKEGSRFLELFGINTIFVGATSFLYHLSNNFLTQFVDFLGMYAFFGLLLLGNLELLGKVKKEKLLPIYLFSFLPYSALFFCFRYFGIPVQLSMLLIILGGLVTKAFIFKKFKVSAKRLSITLLVFVVAFICQLLDINRVACDPSNHVIQFHGLWHIFNGLGMGLLYWYYRSIKSPSS
ncbi:MAG: ceramidase, partial [Halobacteriovoraceae bacterium]|nr:ceramidase [Halobacteriovoraceae bacterium]